MIRFQYCIQCGLEDHNVGHLNVIMCDVGSKTSDTTLSVPLSQRPAHDWAAVCDNRHVILQGMTGNADRLVSVSIWCPRELCEDLIIVLSLFESDPVRFNVWVGFNVWVVMS